VPALLLSLLLVACGGGDTKPAAPAPAPAPAAPAPAPTPAPTPPPAATPGPPATGPYTPDDFAKGAYEKAKAAGADKVVKNAKSGDAAAIAAGKAVFEQKCVTCHGANGQGDGIAGSALPQKPANFHHKERWDATSVGVKQWVLMNGIQGTAMAPLGLSEDDSWSVLAYIESTFVGK